MPAAVLDSLAVEAADRSRKGRGKRPGIEPWQLLVVDDQQLNLMLIAGYLADDVYELHLAESAEAAWALLTGTASRFDLLILDRMMPGMDGLELMRRMKAQERLRHIPIIMQTAAATPDEVAEGIAAGAFYYLTKPYAREALLGVVRAALDSIRLAAEIRTQSAQQRERARLIRHVELRCASLDDVSAATALIASMCREPAAAAVGVMELMLNALEHGNLGIDCEEKRRLKREDCWEQELERRARLPENRDKVVRVEVVRTSDAIHIRIEDQGRGFDWRKYYELDPKRAFDPNGRGIAMARMLAFSDLRYEGRGNVVTGSIPA